MPTVTKPGPAAYPPAARASKRKRPYRSVALLGVALGLATSTAVVTWRHRSQLPAPPPSANVRTASIEPGAVHPVIRLTGVTEAKNALSLLAPELPGGQAGRNRAGAAERAAAPPSSHPSATRVEEDAPPGSAGTEGRILLQDAVPPGSRVRAGQVVAEFDRQDVLPRLDGYQASVTGSAAVLETLRHDLPTIRKAQDEQIRSAQAALEKARLDMKSVPVLSTIAAENIRLAFDEAQARYRELLNNRPFLAASQEADLRKSELDVEEADLELKRARENADRMVVRAPMDGIAVMETAWRGGEFGKIRKGDEVWTGEPFMTIVDPASLVVNARVNQVDVQRIRLGAPAYIHFDAYPELAMKASVDRIGAMAEQTGVSRTYVAEVPVRLRVTGRNERLTPEMSVSADVEIEPPLWAPAVAPIGALFPDRAGGAFVFLRDNSGWIRRKVSVSRRDQVTAAISGGLQRGDVVALDWPPNAGNR